VRRLAACAVLFALVAGCGGSGKPDAVSSSSAAPSSLAVWDRATQNLCREKEAAIAHLGGVHITYGGIARFGLPAVKRLLDGYLGRLLAILRRFEERQRALGAPPSVASITTRIRAIDIQLQAATVRLRTEVAHVTSAAGLSAVFRAWGSTLQRLDVRAEALAQQLKLPACESKASGTSGSAA
jgi:hypothetical protein